MKRKRCWAPKRWPSATLKPPTQSEWLKSFQSVKFHEKVKLKWKVTAKFVTAITQKSQATKTRAKLSNLSKRKSSRRKNTSCSDSRTITTREKANWAAKFKSLMTCKAPIPTTGQRQRASWMSRTRRGRRPYRRLSSRQRGANKPRQIIDTESIISKFSWIVAARTVMVSRMMRRRTTRGWPKKKWTSANSLAKTSWFSTLLSRI